MPSLPFHFKPHRLTSPIPSTFQLRLIAFFSFSLPSLSYFHLPFWNLCRLPSSIAPWFLEITSTFYWIWRHFTYHDDDAYQTVQSSWIIREYTPSVVVIITDTQVYYYHIYRYELVLPYKIPRFHKQLTNGAIIANLITALSISYI